MSIKNLPQEYRPPAHWGSDLLGEVKRALAMILRAGKRIDFWDGRSTRPKFGQ